MTAAKFWTALTAALTAAVTVVADGSISLQDWLVIAVAFTGALGVYIVPNRATTDRPTTPSS